MKKYLFGSLAVVFAIAAVAFTTPSDARQTHYFFEFKIATVIPTVNNVQNPANWQLAGTQDLSTGCTPIALERACKIQVPVAQTTGTGSSRTLISTANIVATQFAPNVAYVSGGTSVTASQNKVN